jgi:poly-gamma-glutamate synthesis protein (capsule biosynthesis protein)
MEDIKIGFTGDFAPVFRIEEKYKSGNWKECFDEVLPFFKQNDINILDLECPLTLETRGITKTGPHIKAYPKTAEILSHLYCKLVVTSNNHFKDFGYKGMLDTYDALKSYNVAWFGSGGNITEASKSYVVEIRGVKFTFINMAENEWTTTHNEEPGCNPIDYPRALLKIQEARDQGSDFIVVILHGGHEHYPLPSPRMKAQFRFMIDAGADAVVGHHTHIISGFEIYKGKPIFYSLGNFCFDWPQQRNSTWNKGLILRLIFKKGSPINFEYEFVHQNDEHIGVKLFQGSSRIALESEISRLNQIIADDNLLYSSFQKYAQSLEALMLSRLQPYRNNYLVALNKRGLLPDIMGKSKRRMLKILAQCESHREVLLSILEKNL